MRFLILSVIFFTIFSCKNPEYKGLKSKNDNSKLTKLYKKALNDNLSLDLRLHNINKAYNLANNQDSIKTTILYSKCNLHFLKKEYDSLLYFGYFLNNYAYKTSNNSILGKYNHLMAYYNSTILSQFDSAFYYHQKAKNNYIKVGDSLKISLQTLSMGIIQHTKNDYFGSKETLTEALNFLPKANETKLKASIFNELAYNHRKLFDYENAILHYQKAIKTSKEQKIQLIYKNNLAATYIDNKEYNNAIEILQQIKNDTILERNTSIYARVVDNLTYAQLLKGEKISKNNFFNSLQIRKKINDKRGKIASYTHLGEYFTIKNSKKAKQFLDTVIQLSRQLKIPKAEQDALKFLMTLQPNNVNIRNRYVHLQDSLYRIGLQVKTQFAKMKYDDELKEKSILQLEAKTAKQEVVLAKEHFQKVLFISLLFFIVLCATTLYYLLKQQHKKEKIKEVYNTEKHIAKKVHDELANDIYGLMTNMEYSKTSPKEKVLDALENIYNRTRNISHEAGSIDLKNYLIELKKLLSLYKNPLTNIAVKGINSIKWDSVMEEKKIVLYRVLNELLVNMKKHSMATLVSVDFQYSKNKILITYTDNGKGIDMPLVKGLGITNTENRIKNIDGTFRFDSQLGKGVTINFTIPV